MSSHPQQPQSGHSEQPTSEEQPQGPQPAQHGDGPPHDDPPTEEPTSDAARQLAELEQELEDAKRRTLLAQADLENTRKRMRRDYEDQLKYATLPLIHDMLEVLDNLHRGLDAAANNAAAEDLVSGVRMVVKQMEETLAKHGCRPIPTEGEMFDPNYHEAIAQVPSPNHPAGAIAEVAQRGYQLHERVVRPSQVVVSTGPPATEG